MMELELYIDGASKGNPGPSGVGVVICRDGETVKNISNYIGSTTNNVAEYTALIHGLQEALHMKAQVLKINTDSQLLYRQIKRLYKVRNQNILALFTQAMHLMAAFKKIEMRNIPREDNCGADKLATQAINKALRER